MVEVVVTAVSANIWVTPPVYTMDLIVKHPLRQPQKIGGHQIHRAKNPIFLFD